MTDDFEKRAREAAEKFATKRCRTYKNQVFVEETDVVDPDMLDAGIHMAQWARAELDTSIGSDFNEHYKQELLAEIERLKAEKDRWVQIAAADAYNTIKAELERAKKRLAIWDSFKIHDERDALKVELEQANAALYEFRRFPHRLREEEQRAEIERLKAELDKAQEGESYYRREFESACERLKYRDEELEQAKGELERANLLLSDWRLKKVYAERDQLKAEIPEGTIWNSKPYIAQLRDENARLKAELATIEGALRSSIKQAQDNIAAVRAQRDALKVELDELYDNGVAQDNRIASLHDEIERLKAELAEAKATPMPFVMNLEDDNKRLTEELERANDKLKEWPNNALQNLANKQAVEIQALKDELERLKTMLDDHNMEHSDLLLLAESDTKKIANALAILDAVESTQLISDRISAKYLYETVNNVRAALGEVSK